jgi:transcriptional regulator with XRE-family HTH domain
MQLDAIYAEFGRLVQGHRRRIGLTQGALSQRVGLSRTSITNIERGRQKVLLHQVLLIAESMGISADALLPATRVSEPPPELEGKLPKELTGSQRDWVRRVMTADLKERTVQDGQD